MPRGVLRPNCREGCGLRWSAGRAPRPGGGLGVGYGWMGNGHIWGEISKLKSVLWACALDGSCHVLETGT